MLQLIILATSKTRTIPGPAVTVKRKRLKHFDSEDLKGKISVGMKASAKYPRVLHVGRPCEPDGSVSFASQRPAKACICFIRNGVLNADFAFATRAASLFLASVESVGLALPTSTQSHSSLAPLMPGHIAIAQLRTFHHNHDDVHSWPSADDDGRTVVCPSRCYHAPHINIISRVRTRPWPA